MLNKSHVLFPGDTMQAFDTLEQVNALPDGEKLALVKSALYSDDHLFKVLFRIALIVDPENTDQSIDWLRSRVSSHGAPAEKP